MRVPVLIVGAGPTGLVLALSLARRGVRFRIVAAANGPGEHSRAMVVHARTLEFYRQFGFADEVAAAGVKRRVAHLRLPSRDGTSAEAARLDLNDMGKGISPFPYALAYAQDLHERLLIEQLAAAGGRVEWNTRLTGLTLDNDCARATLDGPNGREQVAADWLAGCDGAHSAVRHALAIDFPGGTYDQLFYVADVRIDHGFDPDLYFNLAPHLFSLMLPVSTTGTQRLIGLVPSELAGRGQLGFEDVRDQVEPLLGVRVTAVNWFATYRVHHRVAAQFRQGRAFLLGNAAHVHSPAGGQGMNTGIGDAVNLGWKFADVIRGRASAALLDSYEPERIAFARRLVATTDAGFRAIVTPGPLGTLVRRVLAPLAGAATARFAATRRAAFRTVSQTGICYPNSLLSEGRAGRVRGGDRLPWTGPDEDNHAPLASLDWQVHVHGDVPAGLEDACAAAGLPLHVFAWKAGAAEAGFARDAAYLIRPDGYVALATPAGRAASALTTWLDRQRLTRVVRDPSRVARE